MNHGLEIPTLQPVFGPTLRDRFLGALDILSPPVPLNDAYPKDPVDFADEILGVKLWSKQQDIARSVWTNRYTSVASCHGVGKSFLSAALVIAFLHAHENSLVLSTAPTGRQVEHVLWRNIRTLYKRARKPLLGRNPLTTRYDIAELWYAMGFKPSDSDTDPTQGFHAENVLVIIDESAGVPTPLVDGLHAAMTTEGSRLLMIGNPTSTSGPFYDSHHEKADQYQTFNIAFEDTPNFLAGKTIIKGLITQLWVNEIARKYGEESAYYQSRVMAKWVSPEDVLIPLSQIEAAKERGWEDLYIHDEGTLQAGLDVARDGSDKSVLTLRKGPYLVGQYEIPGNTSWETATKSLEKIAELQPDTTELKIDVIGLGVGVYDVMNHILDDPGLSFGLGERLLAVPVNFSRKPHDPEKYRIQRDEAYGVLADRFRLGEIGGDFPQSCIADLTGIKYRYDGKHTQPIIEPKEEFRKRNGHSPDNGDSLALAFYNPPPEDEQAIGALVFGYANQKWGKI